jgi:hypothetical protein
LRSFMISPSRFLRYELSPICIALLFSAFW